MRVTWSFLTAFLTQKGLGAGDLSYVSLSDFYCVAIESGLFKFEVIIRKDSGADQADFEANYKPTATEVWPDA